MGNNIYGIYLANSLNSQTRKPEWYAEIKEDGKEIVIYRSHQDYITGDFPVVMNNESVNSWFLTFFYELIVKESVTTEELLTHIYGKNWKNVITKDAFSKTFRRDYKKIFKGLGLDPEIADSLLETVPKKGYRLNTAKYVIDTSTPVEEYAEKSNKAQDTFSMTRRYKATEFLQKKRKADILSFWYNPEEIPLCGKRRKNQLKHVVDWAGTESQGLQLCVVSGPNGCGKSKFMFHVCIELEHRGWNTVWIDRFSDYEISLKDCFLKMDGDLAVFIDDFQFHSQSFDKIIRLLLSYENERISRMRLMTNVSVMPPELAKLWGNFDCQEIKLAQVEKSHEREMVYSFINLLNKETTSLELDKKNLNDQLCTAVLVSAGEFNEEEKTPLLYYIIAVATWEMFSQDKLRGSIENFDEIDDLSSDGISMIVNHLIKRIEETIDDSINTKGITSVSASRLKHEALVLMCTATMVNGLTFDELHHIPKLESLKHYQSDQIQYQDIVDEAIMGCQLGNSVKNFIRPIKPDLIHTRLLRKVLFSRDSILNEDDYNTLIQYLLFEYGDRFIRYISWFDHERMYYTFPARIMYEPEKIRYDIIEFADRFWSKNHNYLVDFLHNEKRASELPWALLCSIKKYYNNVVEIDMEKFYKDTCVNLFRSRKATEKNAEINDEWIKSFDQCMISEVEMYLPYGGRFERPSVVHILRPYYEFLEINYYDLFTDQKESCSYYFKSLYDKNREIPKDSKTITSYMGDTLWGVPHGQGKLTWSDGTVYKGSFAFGFMTGEGRFEHPISKEGKKQRTYWCNLVFGLRSGHSQYIWPDGTEYDGQYCLGMRHGKGQMKFFDGSVLLGEWINDKFNNLTEDPDMENLQKIENLIELDKKYQIPEGRGPHGKNFANRGSIVDNYA